MLPEKIKWLVKITRPSYSIITVSGFFSGVILGSGGNISNYPQLVFALISAGLLFQGAVRVMNDLFDADNDTESGRNLPIPKGKVNKAEAELLSYLLFGLSLGIAYFINIKMFSMLAVGIFVSYMYSAYPLRLKRVFILGDMIPALGYGVIMPLAGYVMYKPVETVPVEYILIMFLFYFGISGLSRFGNKKGDESCGIKTLPVESGWEAASKFVFTVFMIAFGLILGYSLLGYMPYRAIYLCLLVIVPYSIMKTIYNALDDEEIASVMYKITVKYFWPVISIGLAVVYVL